MSDLVADCLGQRLVECQNISGGIAEIAVSAVNCLGDGVFVFAPQLLYLTEHQFTNMYVIVGEKTVQERAIPAAQLAFF